MSQNMAQGGTETGPIAPGPGGSSPQEGTQGRMRVQVVDQWIWDAIIKGDRSLRRGVVRIDFINRVIEYRADEVVASMVAEFAKAGYFRVIQARRA